MAVTYRASLRTTRMNAVLTDIDNHASVARLQIGTAGFGSTLVDIALNDPSFSVSGDVMTLLGVPKSAVAGNTGTAAAARIRDGGGIDIVTGLTVGTSATDIILSSTSITNGQTVSITAGTITHAT